MPEQRASELIHHGLLGVVRFKENVTNATDLAIGQMPVPTRQEWNIATAVVERGLVQEGGEARSVVIVQVAVGGGDVGEGD